jgi:hypothetical protein
LHASLLGRLDRLGPAAKTVAQVGAAIGRDFSYELLTAAVPLAEPELQEALRRLVEAGLVFQRGLPPTAEYLFKHALVQDTAYSTLLRGPRQALHRRIAEALEQRFPDLVETRPEILAHHYGEAAMAAKAIAYWHLAGKLSVARSAVREAVAQLRRGLSLLDGLPETRERQQLELDIHVTLIQALMAGKGNADPEVVAEIAEVQRGEAARPRAHQIRNPISPVSAELPDFAGELLRALHFAAHRVVDPLAVQDGQHFLRLIEVSAEFARTGVSFADTRGRPALGRE